MPQKTNNLNKFWNELKRRKVFGVVTTYAATAYIIVEVTNNLAVPLHLADWFMTLELIILVAGLPVAVLLSWIFDFTSEGLRKTGSAQESERTESGRKPVKGVIMPSYILNIILVIVVAVLAWPRISSLNNPSDTGPEDRISLAVLPFINLSNDPDQDYFSEGLLDDILDRLCKISDLDVKSRTSSMRFKNTDIPLKEIAGLLGVTAVMEGSVRKVENNVRITVKLINARTDSHLWAEAAVNKALELDSTYSEVHLLLGGIRTWTNWDRKGGEASLRKAIELNPQNAEARSAYSHLLLITGRSEDAMKHIEIALNLDPLNSKVKAFYGVNLMFIRRFDDAIQAFREAIDLDPSQGLAVNMIPALFFAGKEEEAIEIMKKIWTDPDFQSAINDGFKKGGFRGAEKNLADILAERSKKTYVAPYPVAYQYALAGDSINSLLWLEKAFREHDANLPYLLAPAFDLLRDNPRFQDLCKRMYLPVL